MSSPTAYTTAHPARLAYVGLGNMGLPIARHLATYPSNVELQVWNRSKEKYALIPEAQGMDSVQDAIQGISGGVVVVFTSFPSDEVAEDIYGIMMGQAEMADGCQIIFVDQSTLQPTTSGELAVFLMRALTFDSSYRQDYAWKGSLPRIACHWSASCSGGQAARICHRWQLGGHRVHQADPQLHRAGDYRRRRRCSTR